MLANYRIQIATMALKNRLPAVCTQKEYAEAGFLLTYGVDFRDLFRRSAVFVDKILKGAKPADLPVEQPTKFELVVKPQYRQVIRPHRVAHVARPSRRRDRIELFFAAVHESVHGAFGK